MADKSQTITSREQAEAQAEQKQEAKKQLAMAYGRFLDSENGKLIMADLLKRYGFDEHGIELPIHTPGIGERDTAHRDGMREPVRYLMRMGNKHPLNPNEREKHE